MACMPPAVHSMQPARPAGGLIVYDGVCVLCSRSIRFVASHDPNGCFRFVPLQSAYGRHLAKRHGIAVETPDSFIAVIGGRALFRSNAALAVLARLPGFAWTKTLRIVPRPVRDAIYDLVARNRYRWFGRYDSCPRPPAGLAARVIEEVPSGEAQA